MMRSIPTALKALISLREMKTLLAIALTMAAVMPSPARAADITPQQEKFFETHIRPVLVETCVECHGSKEKPKAGFRLDSREAFFKGGESGPAIVHGNPDASLLIDLIRYTNETRMPPKKKLPAETIKHFEEWVKMGAPWPAEAKAKPVTDAKEGIDFDKARREMWSLQPVQKPAIPAVKNTGAVANDIDKLIIAKLEGKGLAPSPQADRRTLIRRVTFDLIGLPPTYEEVEAFVNDKDANAWEKVIDRLLASPHYGERWGRHWLEWDPLESTCRHASLSIL